MARAKLDIRGLSPLRGKLRRLAQGVAREVVRPALLEAIGPIAARMASEAPERTGRLAAGVEVLAHPVRGQVASAEASTTGADYAGHRDLGTKHLEADDFAQRAAEAEGPRAAAIAAARIGQGIERLMR